jgi:hypothetical protein
MKPLSAAEKAVFGEDAVRDPVTGVPIENGHGSAKHEQRIAEGLRREAMCRGEAFAMPAPSPSEPSPSAAQQEPAAPPAPRTIDPKLVHAWPDRIQ